MRMRVQNLSRRHPSKAASAALPSITPTQFSLDIDDQAVELDAEAFESPPKRQRRTAQSPVFAGLVIDVDFDFVEEVEDDMFAIDAHIQAEMTVDPGKMAANRKAIIHNRVMG
jgi:hypothetical protein